MRVNFDVQNMMLILGMMKIIATMISILIFSLFGEKTKNLKIMMKEPLLE
jgi:hypothetical protein